MQTTIDDETWCEVWPDADDVAQWLATLDARIQLIAEEHARALSHRDASIQAVEAMSAAPSPEALQTIALLMHGRVLPIVDAPEPSAALIEAAASYRPMTAEERRREEAEARLARAERDAAEHRRRVALAEKHTGVPYEGQRERHGDGL